ncbi:ABC transporter substrate-binding protein [Tistrella bauzanensis]|uniref:ABC transporter substrate-binding protein n=1 Tax=Tistrella TaxID=171436 RepID=UPI0031F600D0
MTDLMTADRTRLASRVSGRDGVWSRLRQFAAALALPVVMGLAVPVVTVLAVPGMAPARAATPPDTLVMAHYIDDIATFDPAESFELATGEILNNVYLRLTVPDPQDFTKIQGGAAERWEISDDGRTFTFTMRPGITFQSGRPLTAHDAAFSLQRVVKLNKAPSFILTRLGWTPETVDQMVVARDDATLELTMGEVFAPSFVLNSLSSSIGAVVDHVEAQAHETDGDFGNGWLKTNSAGSGAYRLVTWRPKEAVVLEANPDFYAGAPKLKRVIIRHVPEPTAQRLLLEKGDVDIARRLGTEQLKGIAGNLDLKVETEPKATIYYLALNQKVEALTDPKVRAAMRWAIDYDGIASTLLDGLYRPHQAILGAGSFGALTDRPYARDVDKARALMAEAGYADGFDLKLDVSGVAPYRDIAQALQANFAEIGIRVTLVTADTRQVLTKYRARAHEALLMYWSPDYGDPNSTVDYFARNPDNSEGGTAKTIAWRNAWKNDEIGGLAEAAVGERDTEARVALYQDIQQRLREEGPVIVMFQQTEPTAMRKPVTGWISGPAFDTYIYWQVTK